MVFSVRFLPETFPHSALFGSTVDTYLRQSTVALSPEEYEKIGIFSGVDFRICSRFFVMLGSTADTIALVYASVSSPEEYEKTVIFLGDDFWIYSRIQRFLVRQRTQYEVMVQTVV